MDELLNVKHLGPELFIVDCGSVDCGSVDDASDYNQLCPAFESFEKRINGVSMIHHYILYIVAYFYSETLITAFYATTGISSPTIIDLQFLTETERMIVISLIEHYEVKW